MKEQKRENDLQSFKEEKVYILKMYLHIYNYSKCHVQVMSEAEMTSVLIKFWPDSCKRESK